MESPAKILETDSSLCPSHDTQQDSFQKKAQAGAMKKPTQFKLGQKKYEAGQARQEERRCKC